MDTVKLRVQKITKSYQGRKVVKGVDLEIAQGEIVGLLGPNGAGKTTIFYIMTGLINADSGSMTMGEEDITALPIHRRALRGIGYLPQESSVFRNLTVAENIYAVLELRQLSWARRKYLAHKLLHDFGLEAITKSKGRELSGGERRRVEIARTLALNPKFVLLDEPFAGVDPLAVQDVQSIICKLKDDNIGVFITDHNVRETLSIVDRAYIVSQGALLASGPPQDIINHQQAKELYLGQTFKL